MPLLPSFFDADPVTVARSLLGVSLVRRENGRTLRARVVETEAYDGPLDPACRRALRSPSALAAMAGPPGRFYLHRSYSFVLLNVVCRPVGRAAAVLVRAAEPLEGLEAMRARRGGVCNDRELLRGPAKLSCALALEGAMTGLAVDDEALGFEPGEGPPAEIVTTARVGVREGVALPWRFFLAHSPYVSGPRAARALGKVG